MTSGTSFLSASQSCVVSSRTVIQLLGDQRAVACRAGAPLSLSCNRGQSARATSGIIHVMLGGCGRAEGVFDCLHQFPPKVEGCRPGNVRNIAIGGQEPQRNALCVLQLYSKTVCLESLRQSGQPTHYLWRLTCHLPGFIPVWTLQSTAYSNAGSWVIRASEQASKRTSEPRWW